MPATPHKQVQPQDSLAITDLEGLSFSVTTSCRQCGAVGHPESSCPYHITAFQTESSERLLTCGVRGHAEFEFGLCGMGCLECRAEMVEHMQALDGLVERELDQSDEMAIKETMQWDDGGDMMSFD